MLKCHVLVFILIAKNSNDRLLFHIDRLLFLIQGLCFLLIIERKVFDPIFCCDLFSAQASAWALDQHLLNHQHSVSVSPQHPILLHPLHRPSPWRPLSPWAQPLASVLPSLLASLHIHQGSHYFQLPRWHVFSWALEKLLLLQSSPFSLQFHYLHRLHLPPHSDLQCSHYHHCPDHRHQAKLHSFLHFFPSSFCLCLRLCLCTGFLIFH